MNSDLYLDYAATTPLDPRVRLAMDEAAAQAWANPASQHRSGRAARRMLEQAREEIVSLLGGCNAGMRADRLLFTSGGTEANHLALPGDSCQRVLVSNIEHPSLQGAAEQLRQRGCKVDFIPVDENGTIDTIAYENLLSADIAPQQVSVMLVNNETGVLQSLADLTSRCHERNIRFHTDAAQAIGKVPFHFGKSGVDAVTIVPHKFHGPVGIGGLLVKERYPLQPLFPGGFQQGGFRPGTEGVVLAVGFATALRMAIEQQEQTLRQLIELREAFENRLQELAPPVMVQSQNAIRSPHVSNVAFPGVDRQQLFLALDLVGIACSTGSACASGSSEPSPVLLAMRLPAEVISGALRFSFGRDTTLAEVIAAADRISKCVNRLRQR